MTNKHDIILDEQFQKCLTNEALSIDAFPTQRELLYTLTSASSLIHLLRKLFLYIDADIQRLKTTTVTFHSYQCLQRYARETLCPICMSMSSSSNYENSIHELLCENDCQFVIQNCFNETGNPYTTFASIAQGYSNITKQIQDSLTEIKVRYNYAKYFSLILNFSLLNVFQKYIFIYMIW